MQLPLQINDFVHKFAKKMIDFKNVKLSLVDE